MADTSKPARVRFAPSPTGRLHLGGGRTALYDYLLARQTGGQFILRIEDTDRRRYVPGAEEELMAGLRWLGLNWDEGPDVGGPFGPYRQSDRKEIYLEYAKELVDSGHAYYCFCSADRLEKVRQEQMKQKANPRYDQTCRNLDPDVASERVLKGEPHVIRFKSPTVGETIVRDLLRGKITVENHMIDDFILVKSDGWALYHLAAMVDDHLMKITHVIRGSEWLPTFPLHSLVYRAFGWDEPIWVHLSVFLKPSGKGKMSKREAADLQKDGYSIFVNDLEGLGYLPEAVVNWIALMGWSYDDHTEIFSMEDLIEKFSLEKLNPSPAAINFTKFDHFNGVHIRNLKNEDLAKRVKPFFNSHGYTTTDEVLAKIAPIIKERIATLDDAPEIAGFFFQQEIDPPVEDLIAKDLTARESANCAQQSLDILRGINDFSTTALEQPMRELVDRMALKPGQVFGILRSAVTGQKVSPPLFESMEIIGKEKILTRLEKAVAKLNTAF